MSFTETTEPEEPTGPVSDFLASKSGSASRTIKAYTSTLNRYVLWNTGDAIDRHRYDQYILHLAKRKHRPNGIAHSATVLRLYAQFLDIDTAKWQKPKTREPPVTPLRLNEVNMLRAACEKLQRTEQARFVIDILLATGMRVSELVNLRWSDLDLVDNTMVIRESKGGKSRTIRLSADAIMAFCRWARKRLGKMWTPQMARMTSDPVLTIHTVGAVENIVASAAEKAGLSMRSIHPHTLRHSHAVMVLRTKSMDIRSLQQALGHSSLETTAKYLRITPLELTENFSNVELFPEESSESPKEGTAADEPRDLSMGA